MGAFGNKFSTRRAHSEINVTPLVDVVLVLLIIFMVTAPMMKQGFEVDLPKTTDSGVKTPHEPFVLTIKRNQRVYIGTKDIPIRSLNIKLKAIFDSRKEKSIYIHADKRVRYGLIAEVIGEIRHAGISHISFVTVPKKR